MARNPITSVGLLLSMLFAFSFNGCRCSKESGRYYNDEAGYSVVFPEGWKTQDALLAGIKMVIAVCPPDDSSDQFSENIGVPVENLPREMDSDSYYELSLSAIRKMVNNLQEIESGYINADNADYKWQIYTHQMGNMDLKVIVYYIVNGLKGYALTGTTPLETFDRYRPMFDETAKSFKFE